MDFLSRKSAIISHMELGENLLDFEEYNRRPLAQEIKVRAKNLIYDPTLLM